MKGLTGRDYSWKAVAAGQSHSLGLQSDGSLYAWGRNNNGQLGQGVTIDRYTPTLVGKGYAAVAKGEAALHVVAIKRDGSVWCWGSNWFGQLGQGIAGEAGWTSYYPSPTPLWGAGTMPRSGGTPSLELLLQ